MPIVRWICRECGGREVPLSHFSDSPCGERVHPDFASAILRDREGQYVSGAVRVSHGLGCPRKAAIEEAVDFAVDPLELNAMLTGTAWHAFVEAAGPQDMVEVEVGGTIHSVRLNGKMDRLRHLSDGQWAIEDWKHVNDFGVKYIKEGPKKEHVVQTSIYAELVEQSGRPRPTVGLIWYHSSQGGAAALTPHKFQLLPLHEALDHRPYECEFTVLELLKQAASHYEDGLRWDELPLAGRSITFGGKNACGYCSVRSICDEADKGAPF
jgi:hypothetical protein